MMYSLLVTACLCGILQTGYARYEGEIFEPGKFGPISIGLTGFESPKCEKKCPDAYTESGIDMNNWNCSFLGDLEGPGNAYGRILEPCFDCLEDEYSQDPENDWWSLITDLEFSIGYLYSCTNKNDKICVDDCPFSVLPDQSLAYDTLYKFGFNATEDLWFNPNDNNRTYFCNTDLVKDVNRCSKCLERGKYTNIGKIWKFLSSFCLRDLENAGEDVEQPSSSSDFTSSSTNDTSTINGTTVVVDQSGKKRTIGLAVGLAAVCLLVLVVGFIFYMRRRNRKSKSENSAFGENPPPPPPVSGYFPEAKVAELPSPVQYTAPGFPPPAQYRAGDVPQPAHYAKTELPSPTHYGKTELPSPIQYAANELPSPTHYGAAELPSPNEYRAVELPSPNGYGPGMHAPSSGWNSPPPNAGFASPPTYQSH